MVESCRLPRDGTVAGRASRYAAGIGKLACVHICMAAFASHWRCLEVHGCELGGAIGGFVATLASYCAVRSGEREPRRRVIKRRQVTPARDRVAALATELSAARPYAHQLLAELPVVRIAMASGAGAIFEPILFDLFEVRRQAGLVAVTTRDRQVRAGQRVSRLLMLRKSEGRRAEAAQIVAFLAAVVVRSGCELSKVRVLVAVRAQRKFDLVQGRRSGRNVTLRACDSRMFAFQRICRCCMLFHTEGRRLPSHEGVARRTFAAIGTAQELVAVRIRTMAVDALAERKVLVEVAAFVARDAGHGHVPADERISRLVVVEVRLHGR